MQFERDCDATFVRIVVEVASPSHRAAPPLRGPAASCDPSNLRTPPQPARCAASSTRRAGSPLRSNPSQCEKSLASPAAARSRARRENRRRSRRRRQRARDTADTAGGGRPRRRRRRRCRRQRGRRGRSAADRTGERNDRRCSGSACPGCGVHRLEQRDEALPRACGRTGARTKKCRLRGHGSAETRG